MAIKTTYKDDVLNTDVNENRVFNIVDNEGNVIYENVSFVDVSDYTQEGDSYGAAAINEENTRMMNNFGELLNICFLTETSPTSYPHSAGDMFIYNNTLYQAGIDVDKGRTISTGSTWLSKMGSIYDIDFKTNNFGDNFSIAHDIWNRVCYILGITDVWIEFYDYCSCPKEIEIDYGEDVLTTQGLNVGDYVLFDKSKFPTFDVIPSGLYIVMEPIEIGINYSLSQLEQVATLDQLMSRVSFLQSDMTTAQGDITGIKNEILPIGERYVGTSSTDLSLLKGNFKEIASIQLDKGSYVIDGYVHLPPSYTSDVGLAYSSASTPSVSEIFTQATQDSRATRIRLCIPIVMAEDGTIKLYCIVYGSGVVADGAGINAMRIK